MGLLDLGWDGSGWGGLLGPSSLNGEACQGKSEADEFSDDVNTTPLKVKDVIGMKQVAVADATSGVGRGVRWVRDG